MPLNETTRAFIDSLPKGKKPITEMTVAEFREMQAELNSLFAGAIPEDVLTTDVVIAEQRAKIYKKVDYDKDHMPTILYVPGGAFVTSGLENQAPKRMVDDSQVIVLSHRLAPEHRIVVSVEDVFRGIVEVIESPARYEAGEKIVVGGDSSGASLYAKEILCDIDHGNAFVWIGCSRDGFWEQQF